MGDGDLDSFRMIIAHFWGIFIFPEANGATSPGSPPELDIAIVTGVI
jgi:hypothetical protein